MCPSIRQRNSHDVQPPDFGFEGALAKLQSLNDQIVESGVVTQVTTFARHVDGTWQILASAANGFPMRPSGSEYTPPGADTFSESTCTLRISTLSRRELSVAALIARGCTNKQIAALLHISGHTCRHHTERVFAKLGVRTRAAVATVFGNADIGRTREGIGNETAPDG